MADRELGETSCAFCKTYVPAGADTCTGCRATRTEVVTTRFLLVVSMVLNTIVALACAFLSCYYDVAPIIALGGAFAFLTPSFFFYGSKKIGAIFFLLSALLLFVFISEQSQLPLQDTLTSFITPKDYLTFKELPAFMFNKLFVTPNNILLITLCTGLVASFLLISRNSFAVLIGRLFGLVWFFMYLACMYSPAAKEGFLRLIGVSYFLYTFVTIMKEDKWRKAGDPTTPRTYTWKAWRYTH